ncbi:MAG TPA: transglutaminase family protein [Albidovulum sp.]|uniref:transglutaminase family protein n=1 Tax=Albidovulum sp. TaxID=1872424 RepID=UPI002C7FF596|nr:transglutaminase family protein [Albidovulum sp.]
MIYDVTLAISYSYPVPSVNSRTVMRLTPSSVEGRQVVRSRMIRAEPAPSEKRETVDFFGNAMTTAVWTEPVEALRLTLSARVERLTPAQELDLSAPLDFLAQEIASAQDIGPQSPHHFIAASRRANPVGAMTEFARDQLRPGMSTLEAVEAIGHALHGVMRFDPDATTVNTPAEEAFEMRHGVCQDFSHIMITCLRGIGIPAGYVSGFLRTLPPPGKPRLEGADAMHAWVRAWAGAEIGWIEFDPTNDRASGVDHIVVGYGRDYDDVAPVRGALRGFGAQESRQAVDVVPLDDPAAG